MIAFCGSPFDVVIVRKPGVVVKVSQPIGMARAKAEELDRGEEKLVDRPRETKRAVDEIVRDGAVGHET